jgi:hypothetical protein
MRETPEQSMSRRRMLGLVAAGAVGAAGLVTAVPAAAEDEIPPEEVPVPEDPPIGDGDVTNFPPEDPDPVADESPGVCGSTVVKHSEIDGASTYYEPTGDDTSFWYNSTFYSRLETWLAFWYSNTPLNWGKPLQVGSYGVYGNRDDGCVSYHNFGRAFDISKIRGRIGTTTTTLFSARYDQWRTQTGAQLTRTRKYYWATSASLHYHFKHVLTYLYNAQHHNHVHMDNAVSGSGNSTFTTGASAQVEHVQACCRYIWGQTVTLDGVWGSQTRGAVTAVLSRIGRSGSLTTQSNWLAFNLATLRFGTGRQDY